MNSLNPCAKRFGATSSVTTFLRLQLSRSIVFFGGIRKIIIAASGSSRNAGLAGEIMMEDLAGVAVDVEYSSEYYLRSLHAGADSLVIVIAQSGAAQKL